MVPGYRGAPQQGRQCLWYTRACNVTIRIQEFLLPRPNSEAHQIMALRAMFLKSLMHGNDERKRWDQYLDTATGVAPTKLTMSAITALP